MSLDAKPDWQYVSYQELKDVMETRKEEARGMIPWGKREKAIFVGFQVYCHGCDFKLPFSQTITREMHRLSILHFFEHKDHMLTISAGFDYEA